jgi:hypothetical protein
MNGTQQGNWVWDGSNWVCNPDCPPSFAPVPCPPFGPPVFSGPAGQPPWYPGANGGVSFGSTAPPNPVRGHMWWNGTTFFLFDGAAWVFIGGTPGAGNGTSPAPGASFTTQVFALTQSSALNTGPANQFNIVPFVAMPIIDTQGGWNSTTHQYMPKKAGVYLFISRCIALIPQTNQSNAIVKNDNGSFLFNSQYIVTIDGVSSSAALTANEWFMTAGLATMNGSTDYVRMWNESSDGIMNQFNTVMPSFEAWLLP